MTRRSPERERTAIAAIKRLLDAPVEERRRLIPDLAGEDAELQRRLENACADDERMTQGEIPMPLANAFRAFDVESRLGIAPGDTFGNYRLDGIIGQGATGVVFESTHLITARSVALKILRPGVADDAALRRFRREAATLGRLSHPGIVSVLDGGAHMTENGLVHFLAMERVPGPDLLTYVRDERLGVPGIADLLIDVAEAVAAAHDHGIVHRDLKPANLLIGAAGRPKIVDFGLAIAAGPAVSPNDDSSTTFVGTIPYLAPETVRRDFVHVGPSADIYSFAVVAYEAIAGVPPFRIEGLHSFSERLRICTRAEPIPIGAVVPELGGSELEALLDRCLSKDPNARAKSVRMFIPVLRALAHPVPTSAAAPAAPAAVVASAGDSPQPRKTRYLSAIVGGLLLVGVLVAAIQPGTDAPEDSSLSTSVILQQLAPLDNEGVILEVRIETARKIVEALRSATAAKPDQLGNLALLAHALERQGCVHLEQGKFTESERDFLETYTIRKRLLEAGHNPRQSKTDLASSELQLGDVARQRGLLHSAEERLVVAQGRLEEVLAADAKNQAARILYSEVLDRMAWVERALGHDSHELAILNSRIATLLPLADEAPNEVRWMRALTYAYRELALLRERLGDADGSEESWESAVRWARLRIEKRPGDAFALHEYDETESLRASHTHEPSSLSLENTFGAIVGRHRAVAMATTLHVCPDVPEGERPSALIHSAETSLKEVLAAAQRDPSNPRLLEHVVDAESTVFLLKFDGEDARLDAKLARIIGLWNKLCHEVPESAEYRFRRAEFLLAAASPMTESGLSERARSIRARGRTEMIALVEAGLWPTPAIVLAHDCLADPDLSIEDRQEVKQALTAARRHFPTDSRLRELASALDR